MRIRQGIIQSIRRLRMLPKQSRRWLPNAIPLLEGETSTALQRESSFVQLLQEIAVASNEAKNVEEALQFALERICAITGWSVGHAYLADNEGEKILRPSSLWCANPPARFERLRQVTADTPLALGEGLPGRVLASRKPEWIADIGDDPNFPRAHLASDLGVGAAFAFPVLIGQEVVAVLEFFAEEATAPDEALLKVMAPVGTQLGRVVERARAERALRELADRFLSVVQSAPDAIIVSNQDGEVEFWNKGAQRIFGYTEAEMVGQPLERLMPQRYQEAHRRGMERLNTTRETRLIGATVELQGLRKDGSEFPLELSLSKWETEEAIFYSGIIRDVSERAQAQEALLHSDARLHAFFEHTMLGIAMLDLDHRLLVSNPALSHLLGYSAEELRHLRLSDLVDSHDLRALKHRRDEMIDGERSTFRAEIRYTRRDGQKLWTNTTVSLVRDAMQQPELIVATLEDVTEQKAMAVQLQEVHHRLAASREAERVHLARELHDAPIQELSAAQYQLHALSMRVQQDEELTTTVENLQHTLSHVNEMLRNLCNDLRPPMLERLGLETTIARYVEQWQEAHPQLQVELDLRYESSVLPTWVEVAIFRIYQQALGNIAQHAHATQVLIQLWSKPDQVVLSVQDNGRGFTVPANWVELVREGHLGVVGMMERAEVIGGTLTVKSTPGAGTTVRMTLPYSIYKDTDK